MYAVIHLLHLVYEFYNSSDFDILENNLKRFSWLLFINGYSNLSEIYFIQDLLVCFNF
jgi:hypothetical protein